MSEQILHGGFHSQAAQIAQKSQETPAPVPVSETETEDGKTIVVNEPSPTPEPPETV